MFACLFVFFSKEKYNIPVLSNRVLLHSSKTPFHFSYFLTFFLYLFFSVDLRDHIIIRSAYMRVQFHFFIQMMIPHMTCATS